MSPSGAVKVHPSFVSDVLTSLSRSCEAEIRFA
jgi:hypothetical protein